MYTKKATHCIAKTITDILFYTSLICLVLEPFYADEIFAWILYPNPNYQTTFTIVIFLSGVGCSYILFNLKQMYKSLLVGNPFTEKNVGHFRKMAITCSIIALIYIVKCFIMFTIATLIIAVIFVVGCIFCLTLKDLFKQAINYKTENELTI